MPHHNPCGENVPIFSGVSFGFEDVSQLVEADNWICETFHPVGPRPHSQMPSSSADAPPAPH